MGRGGDGGLKSQVDTLPYFVYEHRMPLTILLSALDLAKRAHISAKVGDSSPPLEM